MAEKSNFCLIRDAMMIGFRELIHGLKREVAALFADQKLHKAHNAADKDSLQKHEATLAFEVLALLKPTLFYLKKCKARGS